jgi:excisionase family DNA binding protein
VTDQPDLPATAPDDLAEPSLETLVGSWLTVPDVAERLGIALSAVRRLIEDRELLSARIGERRIVSVPEQFLEEDVFRHLRGTFTVLADGGLDDDEILRWLFTPDETLRVPGTPVDNLAAGFKTEVRRRAMEQAF